MDIRGRNNYNDLTFYFAGIPTDTKECKVKLTNWYIEYDYGVPMQ